MKFLCATRQRLQQVFAETLGGKPLIANKSIWRQFPKIRNAHWSAGHHVLVGDALRTAHFSIGSGTRLAFEDVIALAKALREHDADVQSALQAYEAARRPVVDKLVDAANRSADWYEHFAAHMQRAGPLSGGVAQWNVLAYVAPSCRPVRNLRRYPCARP